MTDWRLVVSHAAQEDLQTFGWEPDVECAGVCFGRYETGALRPVDDGRSVFVRRIVRAEYDCTSDSAQGRLRRRFLEAVDPDVWRARWWAWP